MNRSIYAVFENWSERKQFWIGLLFTIGGSASAYAIGMRYVGLLSLNLLAPKAPVFVPLLDNLVNILLLSIMFYLVALFINARSRFLDILNAVMLSRAVFYMTCLLEISELHRKVTERIVKQVQQGDVDLSSGDLVVSLLFAFVALFFVVLSIWVLYAGFRTATNGKGTRSIILFISALLLALIVSLLFVKQLYYPFLTT